MTLIYSKILKETIRLCDDEIKAQIEEAKGNVAYTPGEIVALKKAEKSMSQEMYTDHLKKMHEAKKVFPGMRIQDFRAAEGQSSRSEYPSEPEQACPEVPNQMDLFRVAEKSDNSEVPSSLSEDSQAYPEEPEPNEIEGMVLP